MFEKFQSRSTATEIMDDLTLEGQILDEALINLERVNTWLGGNLVLVSGFREILNSHLIRNVLQEYRAQDRPLVVADAGCGGGDGLRAMACATRKAQIKAEFIGLDANAYTVDFARARTSAYPEIKFVQQDILSETCSWEGVDILYCSLFLHHFTDEEQLELMQKCFRQGVKAILINDLQRHWLPYYLFHLICFIFRAPAMTKEDGCLSILKGFRREDLERLMQKAGFQHFKISWRWAFRYQLIIYNQS
ncbi:MAG: methyltransferase domain-containing protein [Bacteroidota bacterium]